MLVRGHKACAVCAEGRASARDPGAAGSNEWGECVKSHGRLALVGKAALECADGSMCGRVGGDALAGAAAGVHDGRVVAPAELTPDGREGRAGVLTGEVHGHLARPGDAPAAPAGEQLLAGD